RYDNFVTRDALGKMPNFRWCLRTGCEFGQLHDIDMDGPRIRCLACFYEACVIHNCEWHVSETCEQYNLRTNPRAHAEIEASEKTIADTTKKCPNCNVSIEKNRGCEHMTCRQCRHEFCWHCSGNWKGGNSHQPGCPLRSPYVVL
ncbi:hypothetical protein BDY21DRAFT_291651, partial [Lineolata rhizophorae]